MSAKICLISPRFPPDPGGVANASARLAQYLWQQELLVCVIVIVSAGASKQEKRQYQDQDYPVVLFGSDDTLNLEMYWHQYRWNIIHAYYPSLTGLLACELLDLSGQRLLFSARGNDIDRDIWKLEQRHVLLKTLQQADAMTGVSTELKNKLEALFPLQKAYYVPNSVDSDLFKPMPRAGQILRRYALPQEALLMGFVGEVRLKKGWPLLLQLFSRLGLEFSHLYFVIAGLVRVGTSQELLSVWKKQNPELAKRLLVLPYCSPESLNEIYNDMDFLVFPSYQEGMANAALEAMACGKPIIATKVGGFPDLIDHGLNGLLTPADQLEDLYLLSRSLILDHQLRQSLGEAARAKVLACFTRTQELKAWQHVYQELLGSG